MKPPARRERPPLTAHALDHAARQHLERYSTTVVGLRRVLERKAARARAVHGGTRDEADGWIAEILARCARAGLLDDEAFARAKTKSLSLRGSSARAIRAKLSQSGVPSALLQTSLQELKANAPDAEETAAWEWARRRRLGPFRLDASFEARKEHRNRDLGAMARKGFGFSLARKVIDAEDIPDSALA
jgi:regulatory protein